MKNITTPATDITTPATDITTPATPTAKKKIQQWTFGVSEELKGELTSLRMKFVGPSVTVAEGVPATEKEIANAIYQVAMSNRYSSVPELDENEEPVFDGDGMPVMKQIDNLQVEIDREFSLRKVGKARNKREAAPVDMAEQFRNLAATLNLGEDWLNARLAELALVSAPVTPAEIG
jgi:hypothetical protein